MVRLLTIIHLCIIFTIGSWILLKPTLYGHFQTRSRELLIEYLLKSPLKDEIVHKSVPTQSRAISPWLLAWLFFSLLTCLLILFSIQGAKETSWLLLLPLLILFMTSLNDETSYEEALFPKESYIIENYLGGVSPSSQEQLRLGWESYLDIEWGGEVYFQKARLDALDLDAKKPISCTPSRLFLVLLLIWGTFFSIGITRGINRSRIPLGNQAVPKVKSA